MAGRSSTIGGNGDYVALAYDAANGATLWQVRYSATSDSDDSPCCVGVSPDGSTVYVTGSTDSADVLDYLTVALRAT